MEAGIEVEVATPGQALEGVLVPDFHRIAEDGVVAQLDAQGPQGQRDLEEFFAEGHRAVLAHDPFGAGIKEWLDFVGLLDLADGVGVVGEALVRGLAGGAVDTQVIGRGDPARKGGVEFCKAVDGAALKAQGQLEVALDGLDEPFDFALAPCMIGLGVQEPDTEVGANDFGVVIDEGLAMVGVELEGQSAAKHGLFEAVKEGGGVTLCVVGGKDDEPAVVVKDDAQPAGEHLAIGSPQSRPAGKIDHPQIVGRGSLEGFGRAALQPSGLQTAGIEALADKEAPHGALAGQPPSVVLPVPVEHRQGHPGALADGLDDPEPKLLVNGTALPGIAATGLSSNAPVALLGEGIPPRFDGARGKIAPSFPGPGARGSRPHAFGQRETLSLQSFDVTDDLEAHKRPTFFGCWCRVVHDAECFSAPCPFFQPKRFVGWPLALKRLPRRNLFPAANAAAGCGNTPEAKS